MSVEAAIDRRSPGEHSLPSDEVKAVLRSDAIMETEQFFCLG
jgi:hypothetical protein